MPEANTAGMQRFLDEFAKTIGVDEHVVLVLDRAGWHGAKALRVPANITLVALPAYSPELNPVERVWLFLKQRFLSMRRLERRQGHRYSRVESLEPPAQGSRPNSLPHGLPVDYEGQTIG